jgi:hypothetical protein
MLNKKVWANFSRIIELFTQKNCHKALKNMGLGSGIPYPGVKKAPDPGSRIRNTCIKCAGWNAPAASDPVLLRSQVLLPGPNDQRSRDQSPSHWGFLFYILYV